MSTASIVRRRASAVVAAFAFTVMTAQPAAAAPRNDDVVHATRISGMSGSVSGTTVLATTEPGEGFIFSADAPTVWYRWTAPVTGLVSFDVCTGTPAGYDAFVMFFQIPVPGDWSMYSGAASIYSGICANGTYVSVTSITEGTTFFIQVTGQDADDFGSFTLRWRTGATLQEVLDVSASSCDASRGPIRGRGCPPARGRR